MGRLFSWVLRITLTRPSALTETPAFWQNAGTRQHSEDDTEVTRVASGAFRYIAGFTVRTFRWQRDVV